jgi:hypothetical protein
MPPTGKDYPPSHAGDAVTNFTVVTVAAARRPPVGVLH